MEPVTHIPTDNEIISRMLKEIGYPRMAEHAKHENKKITLCNYAVIIELKCNKDSSMVGELHNRGYL